jgi:hypothetical protein
MHCIHSGQDAPPAFPVELVNHPGKKLIERMFGNTI